MATKIGKTMGCHQSLMQQVLGKQWNDLPIALQRHYQHEDSMDIGELSVAYPRAIQPILSILSWMGILIDRRTELVSTRVFKTMKNESQYWQRTLTFSDGKVATFNTRWVLAGKNELVEYVNPMLGLHMRAWVERGNLCYEGVTYVVKIGAVQIPLPEWLFLGHTVIKEIAIDDDVFEMDFQMQHPLFGVLFRYAGKFQTETV